MSDKCKGCYKDIVWAKHERTGKRAPICKPPENVKPNIFLYNDAQGEPTYRIGGPGVFAINHFTDCKQQAQFRPSPKGDTK